MQLIQTFRLNQMNKFEKDILSRLHNASTDIPSPRDGGSIQGTISGFAGYSRDMVTFQNLQNSLFFELLCPDPHLSATEQKQALEERIVEIEQYISKRKLENWSIEGAGKIA